MDLTRVKDQLRQDEGLVLKARPCPAGHYTIGYGRNLDARGIPRAVAAKICITKEQAEAYLDQDLRAADVEIRRNLPWAVNLDATRYAVLLVMVFNMGLHGVYEFHEMLEALKRADVDRAADEMLDSLWAREIGDYAPDSPKGRAEGRPGRAWKLAYQMRTGQWWPA